MTIRSAKDDEDVPENRGEGSAEDVRVASVIASGAKQSPPKWALANHIEIASSGFALLAMTIRSAEDHEDDPENRGKRPPEDVWVNC